MPTPETKYNKPSALQVDLSANSYKFNQFILTCNPKDTIFLDHGIEKNHARYLNSKASYLIHPFSNVSNCQTKFNTQKDIYQYKKMAVPAINGVTSHDISSNQKIIQNTVRVPSSLYTDNLGALHINSDNISTVPWNNASDRIAPGGSKPGLKLTSTKPNYGVDIKHNSYHRYLGRKKSQNLKADKEGVGIIIGETRYSGNKTYKFGIMNCKKTC